VVQYSKPSVEFILLYGDIPILLNVLLLTKTILYCLYQKCYMFWSLSWTIVRRKIHIHKRQVFIHSAVCLMTGPKPLPKQALHIVRSGASSFRCEYPLLYLRSSSSFLHLLPHLSVTSIPPFVFPSITCCRSRFLRTM
jgi:hypothetical protein